MAVSYKVLIFILVINNNTVMKKWNITIEAENEQDALELIKLMGKTFGVAANLSEPLHHIYADTKRTNGAKLVCEIEKK